MTKISPKLIDIEGNRVGTDDEYNKLKPSLIPNMKGDGSKMMTSTSGLKRETLDIEFVPNITGRFPTQLFTNIKNDRYKYVKNIT